MNLNDSMIPERDILVLLRKEKLRLSAEIEDSSKKIKATSGRIFQPVLSLYGSSESGSIAGYVKHGFALFQVARLGFSFFKMFNTFFRRKK